MKGLWSRPWLRLLALFAALAFVSWAVYRLRGALAPFAVAFGLAYFLNPVVNVLERIFARAFGDRIGLRKVPPRAAAVGVLAVIVMLVLAVAVVLVVPAVYHQVSDTVAKVPEYFRVVRAKLAPFYQRMNLEYPQQTEEARQRLIAAIRDNIPQILSPLTRFLARMFGSALGFVLTLLNLLIIPVFTFYLLYDMNLIREGMRDLVPLRHRPYVYSRFGEVDRLLSAFARGQVTVCLILGTFYSIALTACGVPMGLLVGFVVGFFNLIPFTSYLLGLPLTLALSWVDDQSTTRLIAVAVVFTFGQFVEGNFITPKVVGESLGLHAVVIMLAVLAGGTLFGFIGMLLAVPVTASLSVFWKDLRDAYLRSEFYRGAPASGP
ncbi:MAG TPA: AI-2E family transporter [Vicinamibacteria bacterium]|nr:AI-2E family transporter [Vicinamibacteria bacterium]